MIVVTLVIYSK